MVFGLIDAHDVFQHQRGIGEQRPPGVVDDLDLGQRVADTRRRRRRAKLQRLLRRDRIAVHHAERISALHDVDARQRAPCAADRVKGAAAAGRSSWATSASSALTMRSARFSELVRQILQCQASERQRQRRCGRGCRARRSVPANRRRDRRRCRPACARRTRRRARTISLRAGRTGFRFAYAADALGLGDEVRAVAGVAAGGGGDRIDAADPHDPAQGAKAP